MSNLLRTLPFTLAVALGAFVQPAVAHAPTDAVVIARDGIVVKPTTPWGALDRVKSAANESDVLALATTLDAQKSLAPATAEEARLAIMAKLADVGTSASLALIDKYRAIAPETWREEAPCRQPELVPAYPVAQEAARAAWLIEQRGWTERLRSSSAEELQAITLACATDDLAPRTVAVLEAIAALDAPQREALRHRLAATPKPFAPGTSTLLARLLELSTVAPTADEIAGLAEAPLIELLRARATDSAENRRALMALVAETRPAFASAARRALGADLNQTARETMQQLGDDAAGLVPVEELIPLLRDSDPKVRRAAVVALMAEDSDSAREALKAALADGALAEPMAGKVRQWLGQ